MTQETMERAEAPAAQKPGRATSALLAAVLLLSASGLIFELTLVWVFSATIWYHYAFVAISVALFGWGLGGFLVYVLGLGRSRRTTGLLVALSLLLAVALPAFPWVILQFSFTPQLLAVYFVLSLLPFLLGGAALSLAFESCGGDINRLYFADLAGAAGGVLVVPVVIALLGAETTILATALLPGLAALLLASSGPARSRLLQAVSAVVLAAAVGLAGWNYWAQTNDPARSVTIRNAPEKALYKLLADHPQASIKSDRWNAYSRITSVVNFDEFHLARLFIDSDAETSILKWDGKTPLPDIGAYFRAFPFRIAPDPRVLVIGPGGGADVVCALSSGSEMVTAVEMNPLIVDAVRQFGPAAGSLYDHPKVKLIMDEGRNFIQRTDQKFDAVVLGFVDSWASVASGGLSLTENYLYTSDAIRAYYDCLSDRGALVIVRWPSDVPRLVANAVTVLQAKGKSVQEAGRHILAVSEAEPQYETVNGMAMLKQPVQTIFMLSKSPMSKETVDRLLAGFDKLHVYWAPHRGGKDPYAGLLTGRMAFETYTDSFPRMATPVHDDRPFYFADDKPVGIPGWAVKLLSIPVVAVIVFSLLLVLAAKRRSFRPPTGRAWIYFGMLGIGFIITEVALMQRLILLLGHPIYTLVVILFTLLLACAVGSFAARRVSPERIRRALGLILPLIVLLVLAGAFLLPDVVHRALPLDLWARIALAAAVTFPFGFFMGMPFPLGLRRMASDPNGTAVSALWGINGVASVIGSIGGMLLAIAAGFTAVFIAGAACYAVAWLARTR